MLGLQHTAGNQAVARLLQPQRERAAVQRAPTVQRSAAARESYGVTGPAPSLPDLETLRRWPITRIRAQIERLTRRYGTQNAAALIRLRTAFVDHPSRSREPIDLDAPELDATVAGGWDTWDADASRYREYLRVYGPRQPQPHGVVTMGEGTMTQPGGEPSTGPVPGGEPGGNVDPNQVAGSVGEGGTGNVVPPTIQSVCDRIGDAADWTEVAGLVAEVATGGAELEGALGTAMGALEAFGAITGVLALYAGAISTAIQIVEAFDTDLKIDQLMGFTYGVVYAGRFMPGPTQLPYSWGGQRSAAQRRGRWMAGVNQGRALIGSSPELRERTGRLRLAMAQHGEAAVLNAIWQRVSRRTFTMQGDVMTGYELSWPDPGVTGFH